ncbi:MAG TPA: bifunctional 3-(3-hydroxy-phenyl)propionate/3-hydroxycinnamic acid hydroxylase [Mycobacteriales bacterium]|nr:bifunctional 3-(3-hydroxy-phenyl)propionate/3-hydroxycinnamic acid hydroxylase [Mycobacteriales bacterium]
MAPVVIIGAGPTGLVAANLLGAAGIGCIVLDRHDGVYALPRAVHIDDEVLRIFAAMGLADEVLTGTTPGRGLRFVRDDRRVIAEFRRDPLGGVHGYPEANFVDQPWLEAVLRSGLDRFPHVALRESAQVIAVQPVGEGDDAPIRVRVRDQRTGAEDVLIAPAVLGCDGATGLCRGVVGTPVEDLRFAERWFVVDVRTETPLPSWGGVEQVCGRRSAATFIPMRPDRYRWEFRLPAGDSASGVAAAATIADPAALARLLAPWLEPAGVSAADLEVLRAAVYTFRARVTRSWQRGRVFLLGDAAHELPPFLGQGLGAGTRDAANLTWKLALVLRGAADERLLATYADERRPHVRRVAVLSVVAGRITVGTAAGADALGAGLVSRVRTGLLRGSLTLPPARSLLARAAWPALAPGALVVRTRGLPRGLPWGLPRRGLAGRFVPRVCPEMDETLGSGFAVLAYGTGWLLDADPGAVEFFTGLGTRFVGLASAAVAPAGSAPAAPDPRVNVFSDPGGRLGGWLANGGARAVLLRPDRVVAAASRSVPLGRWRRLLVAAGVGPAG